MLMLAALLATDKTKGCKRRTANLQGNVFTKPGGGGQNSHDIKHQQNGKVVLLFSKWPETTLRYVEEEEWQQRTPHHHQHRGQSILDMLQPVFIFVYLSSLAR